MPRVTGPIAPGAQLELAGLPAATGTLLAFWWRFWRGCWLILSGGSGGHGSWVGWVGWRYSDRVVNKDVNGSGPIIWRAIFSSWLFQVWPLIIEIGFAFQQLWQVHACAPADIPGFFF